MRILLDMNLSPKWVEFLAGDGITAIHWSEIGDPKATDREVMHWAVENDCVVFTHDLDFSMLLALTEADGPSVVQLRTQDVMPDTVATVVLSVLQTHWSALEAGAVITIDLVSSRIRMLPLQRDS